MTLNTGQTVHGVQTVSVYLSKISKQTLLGNSALERAQVDQWLEYLQRELKTCLNDGAVIKEALKVWVPFILNRTELAS